MIYNDKKISDDLYYQLYSLGIYYQPDDTIAVSECLPKSDKTIEYIAKFDSIVEVLNFLDGGIENLKKEFLSVIDNFSIHIQNIEITKNKIKNNLNNRILENCINGILEIFNLYKNHNFPKDILSGIEKNLYEISDYDIKIISYFSTMIIYLDENLSNEYERFLKIKSICENFPENKMRKMLKKAYSLGLYGAEEGMGYSGRTSPITPFGGFNILDDRVMDGREIGEGKGHATEKFQKYNKFRRRPDLLLKTDTVYTVKPSLFKKRKKLKRNRNKSKGNWTKYTINTNGIVGVRDRVDPQYYFWWDEQRNNPYSFSNRGAEGTYPTWQTYK